MLWHIFGCYLLWHNTSTFLLYYPSIMLSILNFQKSDVLRIKHIMVLSAAYMSICHLIKIRWFSIFEELWIQCSFINFHPSSCLIFEVCNDAWYGCNTSKNQASDSIMIMIYSTPQHSWISRYKQEVKIKCLEVAYWK